MMLRMDMLNRPEADSGFAQKSIARLILIAQQ